MMYIFSICFYSIIYIYIHELYNELYNAKIIMFMESIFFFAFKVYTSNFYAKLFVGKIVVNTLTSPFQINKQAQKASTLHKKEHYDR